MTPYYEESGITIFHAEAMDVLSQYMDLRNRHLFDLLLTDPPYGIGLAKRTKGWKAKSDKWPGARLTMDYGVSEWDATTQPEVLALARTICREQIIFGGNYYDLPPAKCWLVWDKENGDTRYADAELAWTNLDKTVRLTRYLWNGFQKAQPEQRFHPTQKPEAVMVWALQHAQNVRTVLDPFMGSGTTLVAAKRLGKQATGIEREEKYCEIAAKRLAQGALPMEFSA
jgi:DNA modification methylase